MDCLSFPFIRRVNQSFGSEPAQVPCYEFLRSLRLIASAAFGLTSYVEKCPTAGHFPSPPDAGRRRGTGRGGAFGLDSRLSRTLPTRSLWGERDLVDPHSAVPWRAARPGKWRT